MKFDRCKQGITTVIVMLYSIINYLFSKLKVLFNLFIKYTFLDQLINFDIILINLKQLVNNHIIYIQIKINKYYNYLLNLFQKYNMDIIIKNFKFLVILSVYTFISINILL